jgi:hypothetical protein
MLITPAAVYVKTIPNAATAIIDTAEIFLNDIVCRPLICVIIASEVLINIIVDENNKNTQCSAMDPDLRYYFRKSVSLKRSFGCAVFIES